MSFGFGIGDFVAVGNLAWTVYRSCKGLTEEFQEVCREALTIHTLIKELQDEAIDPQSLLNVQGAPRKQELMILIKNLEESLKKLDEIVRKYKGLTRRDRSIWNQLRLATVDLEASRSKLILHVTAINAFTASLSRGTLARIEAILLEVASEVRQGRRKPSLASLHETNNDSAWREIENELGIDGISSTDITKHKAAIKIFIQGLFSETEADTTSLVEIASLIECRNDNTDSESPSRSMSATDVSPGDSAKYLIASNTQNGSLVLLDDEEYEIPDISPQRGGVLIEVDWSSLSDLIVNYRYLIVRGGSKMTFEEVKTLLDTMTEDVRRLVVRSPILFRMSTRVRIIHSENALYGINLRPHFQTLTTSKDIKEIISLSAAYYNSLDPTGSDDSTQRYIKPRFLQMVVLLLSLLNNEDLAELKDFLEATYKLKADRRDIELLILKVIPLLSINPRVFLNALVPAIDGFRLGTSSPNIDEDHSKIWNIFIKRILEDEYLLPGTVEELGQGRLSWIVRWPDDGYKSSSIFDNLQYAGRLRTINDIPPVEVNPGSDCTELTVVMTDDSKYVINPRDLDNIVFMKPGTYPMQETAERKRCFDLVIQETQLDGQLYQATKMTNDIVHTVNQWPANPRRGGTVMSKIVPKRSDHQFLNDVRGSGRLVEMVALLGQTTLAVTYKVDGRKVSRIDAVQTMARDIRQLRTVLGHIEQRGDMTDHNYFSREKGELKQRVEQVKTQINLAEQSRTRIGFEEELSDEPIVKCLYPEGVKISDGDVWNGYRAVYQGHHRVLRIDAMKSTIIGVKWLTREVVELSLSERPSKLVVTPLKSVPEGYRDDEVRVGDTAMLLGQYVAIGERVQENPEPNAALSMTNYLKIVSVEEQNQSRRGKNRRQESNVMGTCYFR